jgi:hypothetical protein
MPSSACAVAAPLARPRGFHITVGRRGDQALSSEQLTLEPLHPGGIPTLLMVLAEQVQEAVRGIAAQLFSQWDTARPRFAPSRLNRDHQIAEDAPRPRYLGLWKTENVGGSLGRSVLPIQHLDSAIIGERQ